MTRRWLSLVLVLSVALVASLQAAGSVTTTNTACGAGTERCYTFVWTSTAGGAVSGVTSNQAQINHGYLVDLSFVPGTSGSQPTDQYDVTLVDPNGVDLLNGAGANLSNTTSTRYTFDPPLFYSGAYTLDLVVANAGSIKSGTVTLTVSQTR